MMDARSENIRALRYAAGISDEEASSRLDGRILITFDARDMAAKEFVAELKSILERTVHVDLVPTADTMVEVVIGNAIKKDERAPSLFVALTKERGAIGSARIDDHDEHPAHPLLVATFSCYASAKVLHSTVASEVPNGPPDPLIIDYDLLISDRRLLEEPLDIGEAYLAGAGAIGNGFLWMARHIDLTGHLHIVDDDSVSAGNLQRQIWFEAKDVGTSKAEVLSHRAQLELPNCVLTPHNCRLQELAGRSGPWLRRLIVAVDSRRARRRLQNELPKEVFDASTTGIDEVVTHYNRQPNSFACLGCLYFRDEQEIGVDEVVAIALGIQVSDLCDERISRAIAQRILEKHPHLIEEDIVGLAFDTLYKALCSTGRLPGIEEKSVFAPFAFVSVLAGAMLLFELIERINGSQSGTNEWHVSPWRAPFPSAKRLRLARAECECCGRPEVQEFAVRLWANSAR